MKCSFLLLFSLRVRRLLVVLVAIPIAAVYLTDDAVYVNAVVIKPIVTDNGNDEDADSSTKKGPRPDPNRVIVTFKNKSGFDDSEIALAAALLSSSSSSSTKVHYRFKKSNSIAVTLTPEAAISLKKNPAIKSIEKDRARYLAYHAPLPPRRRHDDSSSARNDRKRKARSGSKNSKNSKSNTDNNDNDNNNNSTIDGGAGAAKVQIVPYGYKMVQAHKLEYAGGKTVCIIDTGYARGHGDLPGGKNKVRGYDEGNLPWHVDKNGHGTHVAGTIAAMNNDYGILGVVPGVNLYIVRVFGDDGLWQYSSTLVDAVQRCKAAGAHVVNMSLGSPGSSDFERKEYQKLYDGDSNNKKNNGMLIIAAAGNDGDTSFSYPASYDSVVSVAAVDEEKRIAKFSQQNNQVELSAPGVAVLSTVSYAVLLGSVSAVADDNNPMPGEVFTGAATGSVKAPFVACGLGKSKCPNAKNKICVIARGDIPFFDKVNNCEAAGGLGAVVYNNDEGPCPTVGFGTGNTSPLPAICVTTKTGLLLLEAAASSHKNGHLLVVPSADSYETYDGTSMASPHVAGAAALVWSLHPNCTNEEIRSALDVTAKHPDNEDNNAGDEQLVVRDETFGYGIVKARRAHKRLTRIGCQADNEDDFRRLGGRRQRQGRLLRRPEESSS